MTQFYFLQRKSDEATERGENEVRGKEEEGEEEEEEEHRPE